jgi:hypothetical protein
MPRLVHHFKLDVRLSDEDRREYERLLGSPSSTVSSLMQWLADHGYHDISRGAVQRHRRHWQRDVLEIRKQGQAAHHFTLLAKGLDTSGLLMADAAQPRLEQAFFQAMHAIPESVPDAAAHFGGLAKVLLDVLKARRSLEQARGEAGRGGGGAGRGVGTGIGPGAEPDIPETKIDPSAEGAETARRVSEALGMASPHGATDAVLDAVEIRVRELLPVWREREKTLKHVPLTEADKKKWAKRRQREAANRYRRGQR